MVRVALVGDSQLTDTSGRDVTKLGPRLRRRGHEVETLAVAGMNTRDAVAIGAEVGDAEWAVYCFGANDAAPWKQVPPDEFAANYEILLRRGNGGRQLLLGPAPVVESGLPGARTNGELAVYSAIAAEVARSCGARCSFPFSPRSALATSPLTACTSMIRATTHSSASSSRRSNSQITP